METLGEFLSHEELGESPYSLGKLIEWKQQAVVASSVNPLEGNNSLLVREINWMETANRPASSNAWASPYSLGKLIEWKQGEAVW